MAWDVYDGTAEQWVECRDPEVHDGAAWQQVDEAWVFHNGAWVRFYIREVNAGLSVLHTGGEFAGDTVTIYGALLFEGQPIESDEGTVTLEHGYNNGTWAVIQSGIALDANGQYSVDFVDNDPGERYYRATFVPNPDSYVIETTQVSAPKNLGLRVPSLTTGHVDHDSYDVTASAVVGIDSYEFQENSSTVQNTSSRTMTRTGRSQNTNYGVRVRASNSTPNGLVVSNWSGTKTANTGRKEQRDSGSSGWIYHHENSKGQHRKDVGWGYVGSDMRQGYYSSPYSGDGYIGVADHGSTGIRDAVRSALGGGTTGSNRQTKGTCSAAEIYLFKESGVGTGGAVSIGFYTADEGVGGGRPGLHGTKVTRTSTGGGAGAWYNLGTAHGQRLGDGERSVCIYQSSSPTGNYASFNGGDTGRVRLKWTWNYVTVSYIAPKWS